MEPVYFIRRLIAFQLDWFPFAVLGTGVRYLRYGWGFGDIPYDWVDILITYVLPLFALFLWQAFLSTTPGKLLLGCRIVDSRTFEPIQPSQAAIRCLGYAISALPIFMGFGWVLLSRRRQAWHDLMAKTLVVRGI